MRKITLKIFWLLLLILSPFMKPGVAWAQCTIDPSSLPMINLCKDFASGKYEQFKMKIPRDFINNYKDGVDRVHVNIDSECGIEPGRRKDATSDPKNVIFHFPTGESGCLAQKYTPFRVRAMYNPPGLSTSQEICRAEAIITPNNPSCLVKVLPTTGIGDVDSEWNLSIINIEPVLNDNCAGRGYIVSYPDPDGKIKTDERFESVKTITDPYSRLLRFNHAGSYEVIVTSDNNILMCKTQFNVAPAGATPLPTQTPIPSLSPTPSLAPGQPTYTPIPPRPSLAPLCDQINPQFRGKCWDCLSQSKIWTAIGCLPTDFSEIVSNYILKFGVSIGGGVAFLYFLYGVFLILTSAGNPEKITQAKEIIVSAISGLLLIIFSIFLLSLIGIDILKIPGFGR